jgi:hypothetical protein
MRTPTQRLFAPGKVATRRNALPKVGSPNIVWRKVAWLVAVATVAMTSVTAFAQNTTPAPTPAPARETPRPQDIDPAVDTSATPSAPAREAPRPEDINPGVDTSSVTQSPDSPARTISPSDATSESRAGAATSPSNARPSANAQSAGAKPAARSKGQDRLELDTTQITGNRELPKVLYIVPWKRSDLGDLVGKPVNSLLDEVLTPVDRDVFRRENRYYRALTPGADQGAGPEYSDGTTPYVRPTPGTAPPAAGSVGSATKPASTSGSAAPPAGNER